MFVLLYQYMHSLRKKKKHVAMRFFSIFSWKVTFWIPRSGFGFCRILIRFGRIRVITNSINIRQDPSNYRVPITPLPLSTTPENFSKKILMLRKSHVLYRTASPLEPLPYSLSIPLHSLTPKQGKCIAVPYRFGCLFSFFDFLSFSSIPAWENRDSSTSLKFPLVTCRVDDAALILDLSRLNSLTYRLRYLRRRRRRRWLWRCPP